MIQGPRGCGARAAVDSVRHRHGSRRRDLIDGGRWGGAAPPRPAARRERPGARRGGGDAGSTGALLAKCGGATVACGARRDQRDQRSAVCTLPALTVMVFTLTGLIGSPEPGCGCALSECGRPRRRLAAAGGQARLSAFVGRNARDGGRRIFARERAARASV